ncbi:unnamed protein product [Miscanthus lutarioriparius]|uniref:Uncharacterized protein n=1 Tax=Miscanthus lutarioriparius TaxID=422564 RepID=A0A811NBR9_9POAL|nr:unnamed protein product [Miscanthus lutarioriparius]
MATARRGPELHSTAATGTEREPSPPVIGVGACGDSGGEAKAEVQRRDKGCARVGRTGQRQRIYFDFLAGNNLSETAFQSFRISAQRLIAALFA